MFSFIKEGLIWLLQNEFRSIFQIQYSFELIPETAKGYRRHDLESYLGLYSLGVRGKGLDSVFYLFALSLKPHAEFLNVPK